MTIAATVDGTPWPRLRFLAKKTGVPLIPADQDTLRISAEISEPKAATISG
jgi:hypothetical protein